MQKQRVEWWLPGVGVWEKRDNTVNKFEVLTYSMVIIANNTVSYT